MGAQYLLGWHFLKVVLFRKGTMVLRHKWKNKDCSPVREPTGEGLHHHGFISKGMISSEERLALMWLQPPASNEDTGNARHLIKKRGYSSTEAVAKDTPSLIFILIDCQMVPSQAVFSIWALLTFGAR